MGKMSTTLMLLALTLAIWCGSSSTQNPIANDPQVQKCPCSQRKEKLAKFQVYVQDVKAGPNTTVWDVAKSDLTSSSPTEFGMVRVMDNLLTAQPDYNSEVVGRAQGMVAFTDMHELGVTMNLNFHLTKGKYKGGKLTVLGTQLLLTHDREMPVVGAAGVFRMARGYVVCNNYYESDDYVILNYKFYVYYMEDDFMENDESETLGLDVDVA